MTTKLAAAHHTVADWDFMHGAAYRSLAADYYISEPTSLKFSGSPGGFTSSVLCRIPATLCLPQGEVRTWGRKNAYSMWIASFRNQAALGSADYQNCYCLFVAATYAQLRRVIFGGFVTIGNFTTAQVLNTWQHWRVFWYNGETPAEEPALCVDLYLEVAGEWVKQEPTVYDTLNRWKDSEINRCGFLPSLLTGHLQWYDDTEIWGPV